MAAHYSIEDLQEWNRRIDELVDGLVDPNAKEETQAPVAQEAEPVLGMYDVITATNPEGAE